MALKFATKAKFALGQNLKWFNSKFYSSNTKMVKLLGQDEATAIDQVFVAELSLHLMGS